MGVEGVGGGQKRVDLECRMKRMRQNIYLLLFFVFFKENFNLEAEELSGRCIFVFFFPDPAASEAEFNLSLQVLGCTYLKIVLTRLCVSK